MHPFDAAQRARPDDGGREFAVTGLQRLNQQLMLAHRIGVRTPECGPLREGLPEQPRQREEEWRAGTFTDAEVKVAATRGSPRSFSSSFLYPMIHVSDNQAATPVLVDRRRRWPVCRGAGGRYDRFLGLRLMGNGVTQPR